MQRIRIVTAGAALIVLAGIATIDVAAGQTPDGGAPGAPIQLLPHLAKPGKTETRHHHAKHVARAHPKKAITRTVRKKTGSHDAAAAANAPQPSKQTPANTVANGVWPSSESVAAANVTASELAPQPAFASSESDPSELVVGGQTVKVDSTDTFNSIDRAADAVAATAKQDGTAASQLTSNATAAKPAPQNASRVGSASWIAQVLAALGGAVAAGSLAWFLIGSTPYRTYS